MSLRSFNAFQNAQNPLLSDPPPAAASPHIPSGIAPDAPRLFEDDFESNENDWGDWNYEAGGARIQVRDGRLFVKSLNDMNYALAGCDTCPYLRKPYYLSVDLAPDRASDRGFGVVFSMTSEGFYLFEINVVNNFYFLYHNADDVWSLRASGESDLIRGHPDANTLGVYAERELVELYINGQLVEVYRQGGTSFQYGFFGIYVDNAGLELSADDLTIDQAGEAKDE
jgi:hypothetical protein